MGNWTKKIIFLLILVCLLAWDMPMSHASEPTGGKSVKFSWEAIDWAIKYRIEIKDSNDKTVLEKEQETNSIEFSLPPGKYKIRIGAINKFEKFSGWSDWADTEILEERPHDTMVLNLGINLSVGVPYVQFLSSWDSPFQNSITGFTGKIGFNFGNFIIFHRSNNIKYRGLLSYFGLELDGSYINFHGKNIPGKIKIDDSEITMGGSLYFRTNFNYPVNLIIRGGGGLASSKFTYYTKDLLNENLVLTSRDPYYKAGGSLEVNILGDFIVEAGADYMSVTYLKTPLKSIRYYIMGGVRL